MRKIAMRRSSAPAMTLFFALTAGTVSQAYAAAVAEQPKDDKEHTETDSSYRGVLENFVAELPQNLNQMQDLAAAPADGSGPAVDIQPVISQLQKASALAKEALNSADSEAFVKFQYSNVLAKLGLARSALTRANLEALKATPISRETAERLTGLGAVLDKIRAQLSIVKG